MMRGIVVIRLMPVLLATACAGTYQSAHTLNNGKTQVTGSLGTSYAVSSTDTSDGIWSGDVMVRHGLDDGLDGGIRLGRVPADGGDTVSQLTADIKKELTPQGATNVASISIPIGVGWQERGTDFGGGILGVAPTLYLGTQLSPTAELVFAPKFILLLPKAETMNSAVGGAASLGIRFSDTARTWAIQPELSLLKIQDENGVLISFGVGVAAGN